EVRPLPSAPLTPQTPRGHPGKRRIKPGVLVVRADGRGGAAVGWRCVWGIASAPAGRGRPTRRPVGDRCLEGIASRSPGVLACTRRDRGNRAVWSGPIPCLPRPPPSRGVRLERKIEYKILFVNRSNALARRGDVSL